MLISGVSFRHRSLCYSHEGDVSSYSECKIVKIFRGFALGPHWGGLTATPQTSQTLLVTLVTHKGLHFMHFIYSEFCDISEQLF